MRKIIKNTIVFILALLMFVLQAGCPVLAYEPQTIELKGEACSAKPGESFSIPISIISSDATKISIGGLVFSIHYDSQKLSYSEGAENTGLTQAMNGALVYHNASKSKITFAWTSTDAVKISSGTELFCATFKILDTATDSTEIGLLVEQAYTYENEVNIRDLNIKNAESKIGVNIANVDSKVKQVETLIEAIGTVSYSDESLNKIMSAAQAYTILTETQKKQVRNFQVLSEAMVEYERLRLEAEGTVVGTEVSAYMEEHSYALALTTDTVTLTDEDKVQAAIKAFDEELSVDAQSRIYSERRELKNVLAQIEILKKDKAAQEEAIALEKEQRKEAQEYAKAFRDDYATFLTLKTENLIAEHYDGLNAAMEQLNMLIGLNPYVEEYLKGEKIIIQTLYDAVQELRKKGEGSNEESGFDAQASADNFRTNFAYVLSLTPETITADDLLELRVAEALYYELDAEVQNLLSEEFAIISELLSVIDELPGTETQQVITTVKSGIDSLRINYANRQMGMIVWILLLLLLLSTIIFGVLQLYYHLYIKKNYKES